MHGLYFPNLGYNCLSTEAYLIWAEDVLYSTNVFNFDQTFSKQIAAYDPLERLNGRSSDDVLDFTSQPSS